MQPNTFLSCFYNLAVLWAGAGIRPEDVWHEMDRRERMLGIAEKLPKSSDKVAALRPVRQPVVALEGAGLTSRRTVDRAAFRS